MGTDAKSTTGGGDGWRVRATTAAAVAICMTAALVAGPRIGIHGLWPGMLAIAVAIITGIVLGRQAGRRLFCGR